MKNLKKFNEGWFDKEPKEEIKPMGIRSTVLRPESEVNRLSDEELLKQKEEFYRKKGRYVDPYFIQEISDRLYGPDSEEYINALRELNKNFRPRAGRTGHEIFTNEGKTEKASKTGDKKTEIKSEITSIIKSSK
jgi:hypothetical protein